MPRPSSSHLVDRYMEQRLRSAAPGGALPSVRQVMEACRVGPQTVADAVRKLEDRHLVEVQPKRGLFRSAKAHLVPAVSCVDVIYLALGDHVKSMIRDQAPTDGSFHGELIDAMREVAADRDVKLRMHVADDEDSHVELIEKVANDPSTRACLTVGMTELSLLHSLTEAHLSVVNLFPASFQLPTNAITTDNDELICKQLETLTQLGHRRIGYLHNVEEHHLHRDILLRREAFYRQAIEHGTEMRPGYVQFAGYFMDSQRQAANAVLNLEHRPTALICADHHLPAIYEVAAAKGLVIGRDLSVVGTDDKPIALQVDPPATSLQIRRRAAIDSALRLLHEVAHGRCVPPTEYIRAEIKMTLRRSTGPAPSSL